MKLIEEIDDFVRRLHHRLALDYHLEAAHRIFEWLRPSCVPGQILDYLHEEPLNTPLQVDPQGNPMQISLSRNKGWVLTMYLWLPDLNQPDTAHDHTAVGVSLIHTGCCYRERTYRHTGEVVELIGEHSCTAGEMRVIQPSTIHSVQPLGGISFNLWGPRIRASTTVINLDSGGITQQSSEFTDEVRSLFSRL